MKKSYIAPIAKSINLAAEESVLLTMSTHEESGEVEGGMSNERTASQHIWGED